MFVGPTLGANCNHDQMHPKPTSKFSGWLKRHSRRRPFAFLCCPADETPLTGGYCLFLSFGSRTARLSQNPRQQVSTRPRKLTIPKNLFNRICRLTSRGLFSVHFVYERFRYHQRRLQSISQPYLQLQKRNGNDSDLNGDSC